MHVSRKHVFRERVFGVDALRIRKGAIDDDVIRAVIGAMIPRPSVDYSEKHQPQ
jgi:hypothetical protein